MAGRLNVMLGGEGLLGKALRPKLESLGEQTVAFDLKSGFDLRTQKLPVFPPGSYIWFLAWDVGGAKYIMDNSQQLSILKSNLALCEAVFGWLGETRHPYSFVSTQMIDYPNAYGITKRMAEFWAKNVPGGLVSRLWNIYDAEEPSKKSHVIPDLVAQGRDGVIKLLTAGTERRQFLHAEDCAEALIHQRKNGQALADVTTGKWVPVLEVAKIIAGEFDAKVAPGPTPGYESLTDPVQPLEGWKARIDLPTGLRMVVDKMKTNKWV